MKFVSKMALILGFSAVGFANLASANDLSLSNDSKYNLSFSINGQCSNEFGVLESNSIKQVKDADFKKACAYNQSDCRADVYDKPICQGKKIAVVGFDVEWGVMRLEPIGITLKGSGFNLFFEGPWMVK